MPLLPGGSLCDQHCFPLRYPSIFPLGLFSMELEYSDECAVNQRNQNVCLLNTVIAVYRLFHWAWSLVSYLLTQCQR